ncbi:acyltransferase family protein, partial [Rodentibacter trehalosifermentans]|uniref:acyltransferase family protein n=1 Tax=Rodentibacter trehalosifermentans TaxID=1908263 RepID=UPI001179C9EA
MGNRISSLDYLRGLCAFSIMIYHYMLWTGYKVDANDFISRMGIYGVSVFYILSGLTLYIVYKDRNFLDKSEWLSFFKKRVLRILPLFSLVTILTFCLSRNFSYLSFKILFLNITGLFSIFSSSEYIATGGWSIENELFFY